MKISDQRADWDPDNLTAPVLEPIWEQGAATTGDGGELASAIISTWSTEGAAIFVEDPIRTAFNDFHTFTYADADSVNLTQAGTRATNMLGTRTLEYYSHAPSLLMRADQVHLIVEGMAIQIKAAAAISGSHLGEYVTRRIAQVLYEPLSPELGVRLSGTPVPLYRVILQLDRPRDKGTAGPRQAAEVLDHPAQRDGAALRQQHLRPVGDRRAGRHRCHRRAGGGAGRAAAGPPRTPSWPIVQPAHTG